MKIKIFDTRMMSPMNNNIFDLENIVNEFIKDKNIHNISIKPYNHRDSTYYMAMIQYSEE